MFESLKYDKEKSLFFSFLLLVLMICWSFPETASALRKTSANRECAICHIMWLDDFKRKDVSPLIPYDPLPTVKTGKQDVVSTDRMCFSCHDGFVLDSRSLWKKNHYNHPVGVVPSDKVTIPTDEGKTIFPMNNDGKLYCGSCHTAHAQDWNEKNTTIFMRMDNENSSICTSCHRDRSANPENSNHPINTKLKDNPVSLLKAGAQISDSKEIICQTCHVVHGSKGEKILAKPNQDSELCAGCHARQANVRKTKHDMTMLASDSKNIASQKVSDSGPCSACHIPHDSQGPRLWSRQLSPEQDIASALCLTCHQEKGIGAKKTIGKNSHPINVPVEKVGIIAQKEGWISRIKNKAAAKKIIQLPLYDKQGKRVKEGGNISCLSCHDPHQWSTDHGQKVRNDIEQQEGDGTNSFLRINNEKNSALCLNCHREQAPLAFSRHNLEISAPKERNKDGKRASESGACSACHLPHNGSGKNMWARKVSNNAKGIMSQCIDCHDEGEVAGKKTIGQYSHPVQVNLDKTGGKTDLPLYLKNGTRNDKKGLVDCTTCHDPHQWDPSNAIAASGKNPEIDGDSSNSFLRIANNSALCMNCHQNKVPVTLSRHNLQISAPKEKNKEGKNVSSDGVCSACHLPHNGSGEKMWAKKPARNATGIMSMCINCHDKGKAAAKKTTGKYSHPVQVSLDTVGGKTDLPLYSKSGRRDDKKGLVDCATCHDPHQWDPSDPATKSGIKANLDGDSRTSFLRMQGNDESNLCATCHLTQKNIIGTDHDLRVTAGKALNTQIQTVKQSGICGQCHTVHNAVSPERLWVQPLGDGKNGAERLCTGCHSPIGIASAKVPLELEHPPKIITTGDSRQRQDDKLKLVSPLFTSDGKSAKAGMITCPTCHDPHQWDASKPEMGSGENIEGDVSNSFLRHSSTEYFICSDCHGDESIFRYKYFHMTKSRPGKQPGK